jgi:DNA polymerase-4
MSREETFPRDLLADSEIEAELLRLTTRLTADLRSEGLRARCLTVKLRDFDFRTRQASRTVPVGLDTDRAAYTVARELLAGLRARRRVAARLVGVGFTRFEPSERGAQLSLLPGAGDSAAERDRVVARAVDRLNARFGANAVRPARLTTRRRR